MMVIYDPTSHKYPGYEKYVRPFLFHYFDGCHGNRKDPGLCNWVVPGTWPEWAL